MSQEEIVNWLKIQYDVESDEGEEEESEEEE